MPTRVAVDAMGGDAAPDVVAEGALRATRAADDVPGGLEVHLFGPEASVREALAAHGGGDGLPVVVHDAPEVIGMGEAPAAAVKGKPRSSIHLGLGAHKAGHADAFVSAGNTGAVMAASLFILGRLPGVARPSVIGFYPTLEGFCILLDVGTNVDCKPEHLAQFGRMGSIYAKRVVGCEAPTVALMNVGEEPGKGDERVKAAYELLERDEALHFTGNIEGRDLMRHAADVVVCDGFVGNVLLKFGESVPGVLLEFIRREMAAQGLGPEQQTTVARVMQGVQRPFNYEEFGGAPLLGVAGNVLIGHGGSTARAIEQIILAGARYAQQDVPGAIASAFA